MLATLPRLDSLPKEVVQLSPVIPAMGSHHGDPSMMPIGPIYCGYQGRVICLEYMLTQADFQAGKSWTNLKGVDGLPPVDHVNIEFQPNGHEGFDVPHYDIHLYFIPAAVRNAVR